MNRLFLILATLVFLQGNASAQNQSLKVISYNIWNGFDWGKDAEREKAMVQWIQEQDPDVIGFQELNAFTPEKLAQMALEWGHPYSLLLKEDGYPIGITSKTPLELKSRMLGGFWHGMLHAKTRDIDFLVVHLSPQDWQFRRSEAEIVSTYIENVLVKNQQDKYMVVGDFNAHSPFDAGFDRAHPETLRRNREGDSLRFAEKGAEAFQTLRNGTFDYSVMSRFLSLPLIDVVQTHTEENQKTSFPTPLITQDLSAEQRASYQQRIDYILVSPYFEFRCTQAEVVNTGTPDRLSDHYPVVASFTWDE
ncbi:endonuclease/exonuclease/phosphatase family protein [Cyclobacterium jeungdonense]|uniref:Endonuclease/exonuclease/phosphatase family protein n=1 Tax=Cyclobacterium jeungdonense TaxID=708087 RepID=A0ABT8CAA2_9BACT|nr:endonuclease/exonuclease/phosphatase family protein [Cyclobacterium jeungdonense]MDN3688558.1 endonuclease/exonuclease/phosphatase family protein [Cyclobacterium jeungdonense]